MSCAGKEEGRKDGDKLGRERSMDLWVGEWRI